jgi:hypothetical protein
MLTKKLGIILSALICALLLSSGLASAQNKEVKFFMTGDNCPSGWRHVTLDWVQKNQNEACQAKGMGTWHIARIANGGSQDGSGYKCKSRAKDKRKLGGSLCTKVTSVEAFKGEKCPKGWHHVTHKWVQKNKEKACRAKGMGEWHIVRLAGGGSQDGWGYKCKSRAKDKRKLGGSLCWQ